MNHPFVFLLLSVCALMVFAENPIFEFSDEKRMELGNFIERLRRDKIDRDLPQIRVFSKSVVRFQKSLGEKYSYLPMVQPYTQIDNDSIDYEENEYPMMHRYKYMFTDESATFKKYSNRPFALPADFTEKVICTKNLSPLLKIKLLNSTEIYEFLKYDPNVASRSFPGVCSLLLFYSQSCPHSILAVPHYLFLHRIFPQIRMMAVNTLSEQRFNMLFEVVGTPTLILFHNGIPAAKFLEEHFTLYELARFIINITDLLPGHLTELTESDLSSFLVPADTNFTLWLSWSVFVLCALYYKLHMIVLRLLFNLIKKCIRYIFDLN